MTVRHILYRGEEYLNKNDILDLLKILKEKSYDLAQKRYKEGDEKQSWDYCGYVTTYASVIKL